MIKTDTIQITSELLTLITELDEFKGAWRALGTIAPERLRALRHVATIESIGSSTRIEGSKLTDREVERLLTNLEIKRFSSRDEPRSPSQKIISSSFTAIFCGTVTTMSGTVVTTKPCATTWVLLTQREK